MCQLVLLIFGIIYAFRIPGLIKMEPAPGNDPDLFFRWRAKELASIYVFLGATWGSMVVVVIIGVVMIVATASRGGKIDDIMGPLTAINFVLFVGPLIWAAVLGQQAAKMKKQLTIYGTAPSYYPRPGQVTLQAPPQPPVEVPTEPEARHGGTSEATPSENAPPESHQL